MIRGFAVNSDDLAYNGLYGLLPRQFVASELLERVEVLRGANSFVTGAPPGSGGIGETAEKCTRLPAQSKESSVEAACRKRRRNPRAVPMALLKSKSP